MRRFRDRHRHHHLVSIALVGTGLDMLVLDRRDVGWGSTAASTAPLQCEIDTALLQPARMSPSSQWPCSFDNVACR